MVFEKKPEIQPMNPELVRSAQESKGRIRSLEQNVEGLRSRINAIEEKVIEESNNMKKWIDNLTADVHEVSESLKDIHSDVLRVKKDLDKKARKSELKEIESLLEIYNPIKSHFITRQQAERIFEDFKKKA
jgi:uncharacterized protein YoxC